MQRKSLFDLDICVTTFDEAVAHLTIEAFSNARKAKVVVTPNVDHIVKLSRSDFLKKMYSKADYYFADGFPVVLAGRLLGVDIPGRVTGADLFTSLCFEMAKKGGSIFILGGEPGEEQKTIAALESGFPGLKVNAYAPEYGFDPFGGSAHRASELINKASPNILFVCLGFPKQEHFAMYWRSQLNTDLILCVGAAMDFYLGKVYRAPKFIQRIGLEWAWRLASDPKRLWKRYLIEDMVFFKLFIKAWIDSKRASVASDASRN